MLPHAGNPGKKAGLTPDLDNRIVHLIFSKPPIQSLSHFRMTDQSGQAGLPTKTQIRQIARFTSALPTNRELIHFEMPRGWMSLSNSE